MELNERSTPSIFVTVVAWVFIVFSALVLLMSIAQNIMLSFMPTFPQSPDAGFFENNFRALFLVPLVLSIVVLVISIGLLKRREWARKSFVGFLALCVLYLFASCLLLLLMWPDASTIPQDAPREFQETARQMQSAQLAMSVTMAVFAVATSGIFVWIINKLIEPAICDEFESQHRPNELAQ